MATIQSTTEAEILRQRVKYKAVIPRFKASLPHKKARPKVMAEAKASTMPITRCLGVITGSPWGKTRRRSASVTIITPPVAMSIPNTPCTPKYSSKKTTPSSAVTQVESELQTMVERMPMRGMLS